MTVIRPEIASRLFNEDCIKGMDRIPDKSIDIVLADPPYGTTECAWDMPLPLPEMWAQLKRVCKPRAAILLFAQCPFNHILTYSNLRMLKYEYSWDKHKALNFFDGNRRPLSVIENILVFYKNQPTYNPQMSKGEPYACSRKPRYSELRGKFLPGTLIQINDGTRHPKTLILPVQ
jgi:site-specific DNA-methyltransferase (adenine-specific)